MHVRMPRTFDGALVTLSEQDRSLWDTEQIARGRDAHITVLYANSRIQRVETFNSTSCVLQRYEGSGFTDLRPVFDS